ncbi:MAG: hypothetical protein KAV00_13855, partial [Phycisphaerae bacterium]|nr:hypothetical protein [Phycisphaerae bacterium]
MGRTITRILASAILVVLYVVFASPCVGQVSDLDLNGDLTLYFTRLVDGQGNLTGYRYDGSVGGLDLNYNLPVSVDIGIKSSKLGQPGLLWSEVSNWNNPALGIFNLVNITKAVVGPAIGKPSIHDTLVGLDTLINGGPTERSVSIYKVPVLRITSPDLPTLDLNFEAGLGLKFDVYLASGADVLMDQRVVLERLTVYPGAKVTGNNTFVTRTDLDNWGVFQNLMGTIEGNFINVGAPQGQGHAVIMGSLNVQGQLINTGEIRINSGSLNLAQSTANDGVLIIDGGSLDCAGGFSNFGTTEWGNGAVSVNGDLLNFGTFTLVGTDPKIIKKNGVLTNANMITHLEEGVLVFCDEATLNNLEGGLYDFQGDGNIAVGHSSAGWAKNTVFNNAGTLRKSAGMGESTISVPFNNTGTIEVSSGTLTFKGPSSSTDGNFVLANGGRLRFASHTCYLQGVNTVTGNGVMEVDGATVEVSDGATAMFGSNSGGSLLVTGNLNRGKLRSVNGGTLTLDYTGTGTVK